MFAARVDWESYQPAKSLPWAGSGALGALQAHIGRYQGDGFAAEADTGTMAAPGQHHQDIRRHADGAYFFCVSRMH